MVNYRLERNAPSADAAMRAFNAEHDTLDKRLADLGGLPQPESVEYLVRSKQIGVSKIDFADAESRVTLDGDATYTVVGIYDLSQQQFNTLQDKKPATAGPHKNEGPTPQFRW